MIRRRVLDGSYRLTAALAKMLGMPWDDGALLSDRTVTEAGKAMTDLRTQLQLVK